MSDETLLYLVPTPIGNLEDITLRAISVLQKVDVILAEDTRKSGILLKHLNIAKPLQSYHAFNEHKLVASLVKRMEAGEKMALISDAGTPAISDPGFLLVRESLKNEIRIECLPGATAFVPALVKSGFSSDRFVFEGFLPPKKGRKSKLEQLSQESRTIILYESPHRLIKTLEQLAEVFGNNRNISVSRELTKIYEETINGSILDVLGHFKVKNIKGEIVLVIEGKI
jgi:16S rRNA (cytidine1402-2'-O)-methyltransferase